jgi:hypothetical protein
MPQAVDVLLSAMTGFGHAPRPPRRTGSAIRTECRRGGFAGVAYADGAGEYIADSARGEGVAVECPSQHRLGTSPSSP